jgi:hypothetical protein
VNGFPNKVLAVDAGNGDSMALLNDRAVLGWGQERNGLFGKVGENVLAPSLANGPAVALDKQDADVHLMFSSRPLNILTGAGGSSIGSLSNVGAPSGNLEKGLPETFELSLQMGSEWLPEEERYRMSVSYMFLSYDEEGNPKWNVQQPDEYLFFYSALLQSMMEDLSSVRVKPWRLVERASNGSYLGEPAADLDELGQRERFNVSGSVHLEVEIVTPGSDENRRTVSFESHYEHPAFLYRGLSSMRFNGESVNVEFGSVVRLRAPDIEQREFGSYLGDVNMNVYLSKILQAPLEKMFEDNYLLFKQRGDGSPAELVPFSRDALLTFSSGEKVEYILCPITLVQSNYPTSVGTTDLGFTQSQAIQNGTMGQSTAWIRGTAEMADLEFKIGDGSVKGLRVDWAMDVQTERPERKQQDNIHLPLDKLNKFVTIPSESPWKLAPLLSGTQAFVGGLCSVNYRIKNVEGETLVAPRQFQFRIRGKNPMDGDVLQYINNHPTKSRFAWAIVQHESRQTAKGVSRVFNQFNSGGEKRELPNFSGNPTKENGWGIAQLDKPLGEPTDTGEVYSWKMNLAKFQRELDQKKTTAQQYVDLIRRIYAPQGLWEAPPAVFVREGTVTPMDSSELATMQLYNGAAWLLEVSGTTIKYDGPYTTDPHGGKRYISCWQYHADYPAGHRWEFKPNKNNYVYKVVKNEWEGGLWYQE